MVAGSGTFALSVAVPPVIKRWLLQLLHSHDWALIIVLGVDDCVNRSDVNDNEIYGWAHGALLVITKLFVNAENTFQP